MHLWIKFARMTFVGRALPLSLAAALFVSGVFAQQQGVVDGRLVNGTNPASTPAGVSLDVIGLAGGMSVIKSSKTDAAGKLHIDGLPATAPVLIRAEYKSVFYYAQASFGGDGKAHVEIQVFEPTTSMEGIRLEKCPDCIQTDPRRPSLPGNLHVQK